MDNWHANQGEGAWQNQPVTLAFLARVTVLERLVRAYNAQGEVFIHAGEQTLSQPDQAPWVETVVGPD